MGHFTEDALSTLLLGEMPLDVFWDSVWNTRTHLVRARSPKAFQDCVSLEELDRLISSTRLPLGNFDMAHNQKPLDKSAYCEGGLISPRKVYELHENGVTIILRAAHYWLPGLNRLRQAAEELFGCPVQANVYLTPPDNQSTPPHWDTHDLFVLQIAGTKRWPLFANPNNPRPLEDERFRTGTDVAGGTTEVIDLSAGDCLYLPRGEIHAPVSIGYSVHVALGVCCYRWIDIVRAALQQALPPDSILREPVPPAARSGEWVEQAGLIQQAILELAGREDLASLAEAAVALHADQPASVAGRLLAIAGQADALRLNDNLKIADGCAMSVEQTGDCRRVLLSVNGKTASFPSEKQDRLAWLVQVPFVTPAELAAKMDWDAETGLAVAETMFEEGIFCRA